MSSNVRVPFTAATGYKKKQDDDRRTEKKEKKTEKGGLKVGGVNSTYRVMGTTPAAADWMKPPQTAPLVSDQQGVGLGAGLARDDIRSNSLSLPFFGHCNPSEYTSTS